MRRRPDDAGWRQMVVTALLAAITGDAMRRGLVFQEMQSVCMQLLSPALLNMEADGVKRVCMDSAGQYIEYVQNRQNSQRSQLAAAVRTLIAGQMEDGVTVNAIAEQMHYSSNYLSHLIKQETGLSLEEMLISMRMERACQLLASGMRVQEVAMRVGYDNLAHFSRLFKRRMGVSPRQYVNQ